MGKPILKRMEKKQEQRSSKDEGEKENKELQARYYDVKDSAHFAPLNISIDRMKFEYIIFPCSISLKYNDF